MTNIFEEITLNRSMTKILFFIVVLVNVAVGSVRAEEEISERTEPFINVNMVLEMEGIETSVKDIQGSFQSISDSLELIANNESLSLEQQALLSETVINLNQLITVSSDSVRALPVAKQVVQEKSEAFFTELKFNIMLVIIAIAVVLIVVIACIYWLVLRPMQSTVVQATSNISTMATAIKTTAQALESSTDKQQQIWKELEKGNSK